MMEYSWVQELARCRNLPPESETCVAGTTDICLALLHCLGQLHGTCLQATRLLSDMHASAAIFSVCVAAAYWLKLGEEVFLSFTLWTTRTGGTHGAVLIQLCSLYASASA